MNSLVLIDSYIHVNLRKKENSTEVCFSTGEDYIGKLFFMNDNTAHAGLLIGNDVWIIEQKNKGVEVSYISVNSIETNNLYLVTNRHISFSNAISIVKKDLNVVFYKDCVKQNAWMWADIYTNETVIEFEMKQGSIYRGKSIVNQKFLQMPETIILCALGWYFIQLQNENSKEKLNYWEN